MNEVILQLDSVNKTYIRKKDGKKQEIRAARGVSFVLRKNHIVALVGESGSGKSTLAKLITGIEKPDGGYIRFDGKSLRDWSRGGLRNYRKHVQMVFQDPFAALNPLNTVEYTVRRPLVNYRKLSGKNLSAKVEEILETVHLTPVRDFLEKYPFELSGGQLQRVVIARAIASNPKLIVADEPVSMLDVSIRADILHLMSDLRSKQGVSFLYITHDLISARMLADEIIVLYQGTVVEHGIATEVVRNPMHPYTQLLLRSIPNPWAAGQSACIDPVRPTSSASPESRCVFLNRCPHAMRQCENASPVLHDVDKHRSVACFLYSESK
jgi:peptide/nickel transport system ATP-binding protein